MNREEIKSQITKFKARRLKSRLANYSTITSTLLALSVFSRGFTSSSLVSFLLVLPLPIYFALQSLKLYQKTAKYKTRLALLETSIENLESKFSFIKFLTQPSLAFRLSLILFFLIIFTTLARVRTPETTITMNQQNYTVIPSATK